MLDVSPLQKGLIRLVVLEALGERAVQDHLAVLDLAAHHSVGVIKQMLVDDDARDARARPTRVPLLGGVVVDHHVRLARH